MTENLLQKLEERMMTLLTEIEDLRSLTQRYKDENLILKNERERYLADKTAHERKLQELISLFDAVNIIDTTPGTADIAA